MGLNHPHKFMFYLIVLLLIGINFAPFALFQLDIWHAQGYFAQIVILLMYSCSLIQKPLQSAQNIPLALLNIWLGLWTAFFCYLSLLHGKYNVVQFFPYFNFLCLLIVYQCVVQFLNIVMIQKILGYMRLMIIFTMLFCVLQYFNLVWFMKLINEDGWLRNNPVVGFIGNGVHLSGFLACSVPLFLVKLNRENALALLLMFILFFHCGMNKIDPSITGFIVFGAILGIYSVMRNPKLLWLFIPMLISPLLFLNVDQFVNPNGRIGLWTYYWKVATNSFGMLGVGLGKINQVYQQTPHPSARHVHNEYLQYFVEAGIVAVVLIVNLIRHFLTRKIHNDTQLTLYLMVVGFLISCFFNFSSHLWLYTTWAMFAYAAFMCIERENARIN